MASRYRLPGLAISIAAHQDLVFQLISAVGQGSDAAHARVLERPSRDRAIVEFTTSVFGRHVRTEEEVQFLPPDRITYRLLRGPLPQVEEEFRLDPAKNGVILRYSGSFVAHEPWPRTVFDRLVVPWIYRRAVWKSMQGIKQAAEERQRKSRVFPMNETRGSS